MLKEFFKCTLNQTLGKSEDQHFLVCFWYVAIKSLINYQVIQWCFLKSPFITLHRSLEHDMHSSTPTSHYIWDLERGKEQFTTDLLLGLFPWEKLLLWHKCCNFNKIVQLAMEDSQQCTGQWASIIMFLTLQNESKDKSPTHASSSSPGWHQRIPSR